MSVTINIHRYVAIKFEAIEVTLKRSKCIRRLHYRCLRTEHPTLKYHSLRLYLIYH